MIYLELAGGLVLLIAGGELLVRGSVAIAQRLSISPLLIGLTLVGFGTSSPELFTSLKAALAGSPGIALGNVIGSNIANILLILGVAALIRPISANPAAVRRDGSVMLLAAITCAALVLLGSVDRIGGGLLLAMLVLYLAIVYRLERRGEGASAALHRDEVETAGTVPARWPLAILSTLAGFALIFLGAEFLVTAAIVLARNAGVSETLVGLTLVAVGTSLPELATSVIATLRRQGDIALGNILGSNIFNVLAILGVTALVQPMQVPDSLIRFDIWVMLAATVLLLVFATTGRRVNRLEAAVFLGCYLAYLGVLATQIG